jgi:hypothetical protein
MWEYTIRYVYFWSGLTRKLDYAICYMQSALSAEARTYSRKLMATVIDEFLDSIKDGNFLTVCQLSEVECTLLNLVYTEWTKNAWPNLQKVNLHPNTRKYVLWTWARGLRVTSTWLLKKMLEGSTFSFNARGCTFEQWLVDSVVNSRCRTSHISLTSWTSVA